jgi:hypothetical protein
MALLYGPDGRPIIRDARMLVGDPAACGDCCDAGEWWLATACQGGAGVCNCSVTSFAPYVYIRVSDRCPGESSPPAVNRVVVASSAEFPTAYACFVLQNAPGDRRYTSAEATPSLRATILSCADACEESQCSNIAIFARARACDPASNIQAWVCLDRVDASQQNGYYFCGGPLSVETFQECPSTALPNAIVFDDWPQSSHPLLSCCDESQSGSLCFKRFVPGEPACPAGGITFSIADGWTCMYCCDALGPTSSNTVAYNEVFTDLLGGVSYTCTKAGPCDAFGTFPIQCVDSNGQQFDRVGDCSSCQYSLGVFSAAQPLFPGLCSVDLCGSGGDRVEISGFSNLSGDTKAFSYRAKQYFCDGRQRFDWQISSSVTWTRGRLACQGGCGLKDACYPNQGRPGALGIRTGAPLRGLRDLGAMDDARRAVRRASASPASIAVPVQRTPPTGSLTVPKSRTGCGSCGGTPVWQDVSLDELSRLFDPQ